MIVRNEVAYPDAGDAKRLWLIRAVFLAVVFSGSLYFWSQLSSPIQDPGRARFLISVIALCLAVLALGFWAWTLHVFRRVVQSDQWPYPRATIERPVAVVRGKAARKKGLASLVLGSVVVVTLMPVSVFLHFGIGAQIAKLMESHMQEPLREPPALIPE